MLKIKNLINVNENKIASLKHRKGKAQQKSKQNTWNSKRKWHYVIESIVDQFLKIKQYPQNFENF